MQALRDKFATIFRRRAADYKQTFSTPVGARVLNDLAQFCRADVSTFNPDARVHAVLEGRREVWLRIQKHLHLTPEQIAQLRFNELSLERTDNA